MISKTMLVSARLARRIRGRYGALALGAILAACAGVATSAQEASPPPTTAAGPSIPTTSTAADYIIGPGDVLQVFVWRNPELTITVPVRPDGKVSTPLVEDMVAVGKTPSVLARDIEKVLAEYIRSPQVNVIVSTPVGSLSQVKTIGQVKSPQGVAYRDGMHVLDLLLAVGGLTDFAAGNRAKIVRTEGGKSREIPVKLENLVNKGDMSQNIELRPGDVLIVPESRL
jgi:polysaccharide export outer membrane protein